MEPPVNRRSLLSAWIDPEKAVSHVEVQEIRMMPGAKAPLHLHPCPTLGVITEGCITFQIEGEPEQQLRAGDGFYEPPNVRVAKFNNESESSATFVAYYLLGKDEQETVRVLPA